MGKLIIDKYIWIVRKIYFKQLWKKIFGGTTLIKLSKKLSIIFGGIWWYNIFPTKLKTLLNFNYLIFLRILIASILAIIFLTIKKIDINKINLKNIRPPIGYFLFYINFHKKSTRKLRQKSTNSYTCNYSNKISN